MNAEISLLADHPEYLPTLVEWLNNEWGDGNEPGCGKLTRTLQARANRNKLPTTLVALEGKKLLGTASLRFHEMETHRHLEHWLSSVYIHPPFREMGIGSQLISSSVSKAQQLGINKLYLYTRSKQAFYTNLGWQEVEDTIFHGRHASILIMHINVL